MSTQHNDNEASRGLALSDTHLLSKFATATFALG